jgi:hypothetical protein
VAKKPEIEQNRRGLMKLMRETAHNRSLYDVFRDFCEMSALALSNAFDKPQFEDREKRYFEVIKPYATDDLAKLARMLPCLVGELEAVQFDDVLGRTFMELELANKDAGQFFTPYHLCQAMARIQVDEGIKERIEGQGFVTVNDPACGGAATLIAFCEAVRGAGFNPQTQVHVTAQDVDIRCVHMAYVQLSLLHIPAVVICGNTLTLEERSRWYTPAHILGGWSRRLRSGRLDKPAEQLPAVPDPGPIVQPQAPQQIALFAEAQ